MFSATRSTRLPALGLMKVKDPESGGETWIDTSSRRVRNDYANWWKERQSAMLQTFKQSSVDNVSVSTEDDYARALLLLFQRRR